MLKLLTFTLLCASAAAAQAYRIPAGSKLYIEHMDQDLDAFLRAEMVKQKIKLVIVGSADEAEYLMVGTATPEERRKWHSGWLTPEQDRTTGAASIVKKSDKSLVWAGEAGDKSLWWGAMARGGQRKVAARLIGNLSKYVKPVKE